MVSREKISHNENSLRLRAKGEKGLYPMSTGVLFVHTSLDRGRLRQKKRLMDLAAVQNPSSTSLTVYGTPKCGGCP